VSTALALLEEHGAEALTMRRLADQLGIRAPSLYKHLAGKSDLETAVIAVGFEDLATALEEATARRYQAHEAGQRLTGMGRAYREFALGRPHLYRLMNERPLARELLPPGLEDRAAAPLVAAVGGDPDLARAVWAFTRRTTDRSPSLRPVRRAARAHYRRGVAARMRTAVQVRKGRQGSARAWNWSGVGSSEKL
jgi:AcrR family transcriptional regulator